MNAWMDRWLDYCVKRSLLSLSLILLILFFFFCLNIPQFTVKRSIEIFNKCLYKMLYAFNKCLSPHKYFWKTF